MQKKKHQLYHARSPGKILRVLTHKMWKLFGHQKFHYLAPNFFFIISLVEKKNFILNFIFSYTKISLTSTKIHISNTVKIRFFHQNLFI
jgi:hypothetical protein